jgi:hypothetical protein
VRVEDAANLPRPFPINRTAEGKGVMTVTSVRRDLPNRTTFRGEVTLGSAAFEQGDDPSRTVEAGWSFGRDDMIEVSLPFVPVDAESLPDGEALRQVAPELASERPLPPPPTPEKRRLSIVLPADLVDAVSEAARARLLGRDLFIELVLTDTLAHLAPPESVLRR